MPGPSLIGRYRLAGRLGSGGFAVVWRAHDEALDTTIAIKIMAENWADRMDLRERFLSEAQLLRRAAGPRVVQVFDIGELPDGRPYFVMELADRGTLADRIATGEMPLPAALRTAAEVARGVADLHRAGIVHRDIKPSNVLIASIPGGGDGASPAAGAGTGAERLLIADLGVAKNLAQASGLTMSVGSAGYMAPEQAVPNTDVDVRADVYSLGALTYRLVTGVVPAGPGQLVSPQRLRPELPGDVQRVLLRALEPRRDRRWPDASSLAAELDRLAGRVQTAALDRRARRIRRRGLLAVAGAAVLLSAAGLGYAGLRAQNQTSGHGSPGATASIQVRDATGRIAIDVPRRWATQLVPGGWNPGALGLTSSSTEPGLLVSTSTASWPNLGVEVDGALAGLSADPRLSAAVAAVTHPGCTYQGDRPYRGGGWTGTIRRWTGCTAASDSLEEIALSPVRQGAAAATGPANGVYLQLRQSGGPDATQQVLASLRVGA